MAPITLEVSVRIFRDPASDTGMYVGVIDPWDISSCGKTVAETVQMTEHAIDGYLETARKLGTLERELRKAGARSPTGDATHFHVKIHISVEGDRDVQLAF